MNLLHDVSSGKNAPKEINVIIEINKGSKNKYEIDKETGLIALDRVMHTSQDYPFDYGFVPQTLWHDGDALDVVLLTTYPLLPGILVSVRPVAVMEMVDSGERDEKILAVPVDDPRFASLQDLKDVNSHTLKEIEHFFATYKQIQKKSIEIKGWHDVKTAEKNVLEAIAMYQKKAQK